MDFFRAMSTENIQQSWSQNQKTLKNKVWNQIVLNVIKLIQLWISCKNTLFCNIVIVLNLSVTLAKENLQGGPDWEIISKVRGEQLRNFKATLFVDTLIIELKVRSFLKQCLSRSSIITIVPSADIRWCQLRLA